MHAQIKSNRREFLALTGLTPREFQLVLPAFEQAYGRRYPATKTLGGEEPSTDSPRMLLQILN